MPLLHYGDPTSTIEEKAKRTCWSDARPCQVHYPSDWWHYEIVAGYLGDKGAENEGVKEILEVVSLLEEAGIPCCNTDVMAVQYYGASRVRSSVSAVFTSLQNLGLLITNSARTGESASLQYSS